MFQNIVLYLRGCSSYAIRVTLRDFSCTLNVARHVTRGCVGGRGRGCGQGRRRGRGYERAGGVGVGVGENERGGHGQAGIQVVVIFSCWSFFLFVYENLSHSPS